MQRRFSHPAWPITLCVLLSLVFHPAHLTLPPPLSLLFCSRSTSSISYTLISKVSVVAVAPRRFGGAWGPSGPSTQQAPGLEEEEEEEVTACFEERWEGEEEEESKVSAGTRRRRWRPGRTNNKDETKTHVDDTAYTLELELSHSLIEYYKSSWINVYSNPGLLIRVKNFTQCRCYLHFLQVLHCCGLCIMSGRGFSLFNLRLKVSFNWPNIDLIIIERTNVNSGVDLLI